MIPFLFVVAAIASTDVDQGPGRQTTIAYAANGGLRDWQPVAGSADELYVRDRTERWYRVRLTGPCGRNRAYTTLTYSTDANGTFDRFSRVSFANAGPVVCGVTSIVRSTPPPQIDSRGKH